MSTACASSGCAEGVLVIGGRVVAVVEGAAGEVETPARDDMVVVTVG